MVGRGSEVTTKIAVLEERLSSYELMMKKIDEAIQIMGKTSQNISKMLAVHEEKIEQCIRTDDLITKMFHELRDEHKESLHGISEKIHNMEEKVEEISKIKWMTIGSAAVLTVLITAFSSLVSGWWTPSEIQTYHKTPAHKLD